jgi:hypothetical protein
VIQDNTMPNKIGNFLNQKRWPSSRIIRIPAGSGGFAKSEAWTLRM